MKYEPPGSLSQSERLEQSEPPTSHSSPREPTHPILNLQRTIGNRAVQRLVQAKLAAAHSQESPETKANHLPEPIGGSSATTVQRKCACGGIAGPDGECAQCREKRILLQSNARTSDRAAGQGNPSVPAIVDDVLRTPGEPLDPATRTVMESRFGHDFASGQTHLQASASGSSGLTLGGQNDPLESAAEATAETIINTQPDSSGQRYDLSHVRVHTDDRAAASARALDAHAYTVGHDVVFGAGGYAPDASRGVRLLAHELTHVVQQDAMPQSRLIQRDGMGDVHLAEACDDFIDKIHAAPAFTALNAENRNLTEEIITEIRKRSRPDQYHFLSLLKLLFDTPVKPPATISAETQASTTTAATAEKARLKQPAEAKNVTLEEKASSDPKRKWVAIPGKFGGGTYYVDRSSPTNIVVKANILLTPKGTGTKKDVDAIKRMEDAIEKAASTKGYLVDIRFVDTATPDTFKVDVDPSKWEVATNWSGGDPVGFAHELHHMFAFELDRYDYTRHASNESMEIPDRLYWFRQELKKPPNYNDPTSIMSSAAHPNDDDACRVAGLDPAICVPARASARAAAKP